MWDTFNLAHELHTVVFLIREMCLITSSPVFVREKAGNVMVPYLLLLTSIAFSFVYLASWLSSDILHHE